MLNVKKQIGRSARGEIGYIFFVRALRARFEKIGRSVRNQIRTLFFGRSARGLKNRLIDYWFLVHLNYLGFHLGFTDIN